MRKLLLLVGISMISVVGWGQVQPQLLENGWLTGTVVPSSCKVGNSPTFLLAGSPGALYDCINGSYVIRANGGLGTGTVTQIVMAGTANQITVTGTCTITTIGTCTFSIPSSFILPGTINKLTLTQPATGAVITVVDGMTLTVDKSIEFDGTSGVKITFPSSNATVATLGLTNTFTGRQDATGAASTAPTKTGTSVPGTCTVGDIFFKSDATAGQNLYFCASTNVYTQQLNTGGGGSSSGLTVSINTGASTCSVLTGSGSCTASPTAGTGGTPGAIINHGFGQFIQFDACYSGATGNGTLLGGISATTSVTDIVQVTNNQIAISFSGATTAACGLSTVGGIGSPGTNGTNGAGYTATSTNSLTPGTTAGATSITTNTGLAYVVGSCLQVTSNAVPTAFIVGPVTAYNSGTGALTFTATTAASPNVCSGSGGSGAHTDWNLSIAGNAGSQGTPGAAGTPGGIANDVQINSGGVSFAGVNNITAPTMYLSQSGNGSVANAPVFKVIPLVDLPAADKIRTCVITIGDPGAASTALADDNDSPVACGNSWGTDWTITSVSVWANAGSPTLTPILTGGAATSVLTGAVTAGTGSWAAGTVNGSPVVHSFSANGATCSVTPCTVDVNITTAGGVAKYIVVRIVGTI
jgi:hypothetical protein